MKKIITWLLLFTLVVGLFAGCKQQEPAPVVDTPTVNQAMDYLKAMYPNEKEAQITAVDYERMGVVRINNVPFEVVWTVDVSEDLVKIVANNDGVVTIDINEQCQEDTPYTLTATITDAKGQKATHNWSYIVPKAADMGEIVDIAYALQSGESMEYEVTLTGEVLSVPSPYDPSYKNITVVIEVADRPGKPIECYRMKGDGVEEIAIGDTITVTGIIKNYNGKIEFDAGCICSKIIPGERIEAPTDMKQIVDEAYALGANKSLPYEAVLTGVITKIDAAYDPSYKNISVVIAVEGRESKPILVYRLKGENADKIGVNDIITVRGYITNYVGSKGYSTIEYTAGCQLVAWEDKAGPEVPSDMKQIVDEAYALGANDSLKYEATLTGKITKVKTAYDANYGNISVEFVVEGRESKPILAYRMKGDGVEVLDIGDTITVSGYITNYVGDAGYSTIEYTAGCKLVSYKKNTNVAPSDPLEIVRQAYALAAGKQLPYKATLTGKITKIKTAYDAGYNNVSVIIVVEGAEDKPITCHRMKGSGADKIAVGDTITVTGYIENYVHSSGDTEVEFTAGCTLDKWTAGSDRPEEPDIPVSGNATVVTDPVADTAYKFGMNQVSAGAMYYFNGTLSGNYLGTTTNPAEAVDVFVESAGNGYYMYFMNGDVKTYIAMEEFLKSGNTYYNAKAIFTTEEPASAYTWNSTLKSGSFTTEHDTFYFGTYGTYTTVGCTRAYYVTDSNAGNVDVSQFIGRFYTVEIEEEPEEPTEPDDTKEPTVVTEPVFDTAYKFGLFQGAASMQKYLYFNGTLASGKYLGTTENPAEAVDVYLELSEEIEGAAYLYFMDGDVKTYITMEEYYKEDKGYYSANVVFTTEVPALYYTWNETIHTIVTNTGNDNFCFGTYSTYNTISCTSDYYYEQEGAVGSTQFIACFYTVEIDEEEPEDPTEPTVPEETEPTVPEETEPAGFQVVDAPVAGTAYKFGMVQKNVSETDVYYLNGNMSGYYMGTTTDAGAAVDVYLEETEGGYYLYAMVGGAKQYINMVVSGTHVNGKFENAAATVYTYNEDSKTVISVVNDADYWFGTRNDNTYTTVGPVKTSYNGFYMQFYAEVTTEPEVPTEPTVPEETEPEETVPEETVPEETEPAGFQVVDAPVAGTAYKFGMVQKNVSETDVYYLNGTLSGYYMGTTTDAGAAVDVYLEETEGGYYLYAMVGGAKQYINMVVSGTYVNGKYEDAAATVYTYNEDSKTVIAVVNDADYWIGTRNDMTYTTVGPVKTSYNGFYMQFYAEAATEPEVPTEPTEPEVTEPTEPEETEPEETKAPVLATLIYEEMPYFLGMYHTSEEVTYYFNGTLSGKYLGATTDYTQAANIYFEVHPEVDGAAYIYFMDGDVKTYITMTERLSGSYYKADAAFSTEVPSVYYTYSTDLNTFVCNTGNDTFCFGTYGTFTTFGCTGSYYVTGDNAANVDASQYIGRIYELEADEVEVMGDREILELAYALEPGQTTEESYMLAGYITQIKDVWNSQYSNISVVFEVPGCEDLPMLAYRLSGDGAETLAVGDIIIVSGQFTNYNGTIEYAQGCQLLGKLTMADIVDTIYSYDFATDGDMESVRLTGVVTSIDNAYSEQYGNISVTIAVAGKEDKPIACYRVVGEGIADIAVGDTITVQGNVTYYEAKDSYQFTAGSQVLSIVPAESGESATITFNDKAKRTELDSDHQVWVENGITVTNNKGASTSNVADYANPARFYKNSTVTVEYANGINKIVFDCNTNDYAAALQSSIASGNVTVDKDKVTVTFDAPVESFSVVLSGGQVRVDSITVS